LKAPDEDFFFLEYDKSMLVHVQLQCPTGQNRLIQIAITGYHCTPFCYSKITIECIHKFKDIHGRIKEFTTLQVAMGKDSQIIIY